MKLTIDIDEHDYNDIAEQVEKNDYPDMCTGRTIANGTPVYEHERLKSEWLYKYSLCDSKYYVCPICNRAIEVDYPKTLKDFPFCHCGADMRKPNCVTCDHFGECDGCEKGDEE